MIVGGPDAMDWMAAVTHGIRTKWFSDTLHSLLKPGKCLSWLICFLTGPPGRRDERAALLTDAVDFELPGPIPLVFERNYDSRDRYEGPLGPGVAPPARRLGQRGAAAAAAAQGAPARRPREPARRARASASRCGSRSTATRCCARRSGYRLTFWDGLAYHFEPVEGAHVTHPLVKITDRCDNAVELRYEDGRLVTVIDSVGRGLALPLRGRAPAR